MHVYYHLSISLSVCLVRLSVSLLVHLIYPSFHPLKPLLHAFCFNNCAPVIKSFLCLCSISIGKNEYVVFCKYLIITINLLYKIYFKMVFDTGKPEHVYEKTIRFFIIQTLR